MPETMTSWTVIDEEKCNQCGLCVIRCPSNYSQEDDFIVARAGEMTCNLCGHCVALCPTEAIVHEKMDVDNFPDLNHKLKIDPAEFFDFVRARRSIRHFKDKPIPREDLESLVDLCRYAPTGSNRQTVEILVVQDRDRINTLSNLTVDYFQENIDQVEGVLKTLEDEGKPIPPEMEAEVGRLMLARRIVMARGMGMEVIFHGAPAVMIFHSPPNPSTPRDDCVIKAQTVVLAAMTLGLGTCYIGLFDFAARAYAPVIESLDLPKGNRVGSVLIMGYPKLKFQRAVDRFPIKVRWE